MPYRGIDQNMKNEMSPNLQIMLQLCNHLTVFNILRSESSQLLHLIFGSHFTIALFLNRRLVQLVHRHAKCVSTQGY